MLLCQKRGAAISALAWHRRRRILLILRAKVMQPECPRGFCVWRLAAWHGHERKAPGPGVSEKGSSNKVCRTAKQCAARVGEFFRWLKVAAASTRLRNTTSGAPGLCLLEWLRCWGFSTQYLCRVHCFCPWLDASVEACVHN